MSNFYESIPSEPEKIPGRVVKPGLSASLSVKSLPNRNDDRIGKAE
jgi:hypothetical protein